MAIAELSQQVLADIVARASPLAERLSGAHEFEASPRSRALADRRWIQWTEVAANGDADGLRRRLAWDGLDPEATRKALGAVRPRGGLLEHPPAWVASFSACLAEAKRWAREKTRQETPPRCLFRQDPLPFEELFVPFVRHASARVRLGVGERYDLLADDVHAVLEHQLLAELTDLAAPPLQIQFSTGRDAASARLDRMVGAQANEYRAFLDGQLEAGLLPLFTKYPVLARTSGILVDDWIQGTEAFLRRLADDWDAIVETYFPSSPAQRVTGIQANLSDRHEGGGTVSILRFDNGAQLVYKPRGLELCVAFYDLLAWCNGRGLELPFKILRTLPRSGYGWVEFVREEACPDREGVARYYERAGMMLCMTHVLEAMDLHYQNVIACGDQPVIVDTEALFSPRIRLKPSGNARLDAMAKGFRELDNSVLRTGLLPRWQLRDPGKSFDSAGLWDNDGQVLPYQLPAWRGTNTDEMAMEYRPTRTEPRTNVPSLDGQKLPVTDFIKELTRGFDRMYRFLMRDRAALSAEDGPLARFAGLRSRFVFRPTQVYYYVLQRSLKPRWLADGAERSIQIDVLARALLRSRSAESLGPILAREIAALERLDIPFFTAGTRSDALEIGEQRTGALFEESSFARVQARLAALDENDRHRQEMIVLSSLSTRSWGNRVEVGARSPGPVPESEAGPFREQLFVASASEIAATLEDAAIGGDDGSATWLSPQYIPAADQYQLLPMRECLYDGNVGVALFLAALHAVRPSADLRSLALRALHPVQSKLRDPKRVGMLVAGGIGGAQGIGSILYGLVRCSTWLDAPDLLGVADEAAGLIDERAIAGDRTFDVMFGSAGAVLGLLARHEHEPTDRILDAAVACGEHLLAQRTGDAGRRSWVTSEEKRLTGFSHGAAGIAYALLRLSRATQDARFRDAAKEAIAYEDELILPAEGNWPDLRSINADRVASMCTWCHGACGIGLARVGGLGILDTESVRRDIDVALAKSLAHPFAEIDHLCCGNLGRAELLLAAGRALDRPELVDSARRLAQRVVARAGLSGDYANVSYLTANLGFFQGTSGIGYELLRLTNPGLLPSVLLWE